MSKAGTNFTDNYLNKFEWNKYTAVYSPKADIDTIVVIPAIDERENIQKLLHSLSRNSKKSLTNTLFLFVINNLVSSSDEVKLQNKLTLQDFNDLIQSPVKSAASSDASSMNLAYIDAASGDNALPAKTGGVGLARKTGMDTALQLFSDTAKRKILVCLDADCTVAPNYLDAIRKAFMNDSVKCISIQYAHIVEKEKDEFQEAITCYEIFLRYYVLGLVYARSIFAFHSIGSAIACDIETYIKCGGMPKNKAGEDFYFLEKAAKVTKVHTLNSTKVYPSARPSWRVPFGTGQRVERFLDKKIDEYFLYNPESFSVLYKWLTLFQNQQLPYDELIQEAERINLQLRVFLENSNLKDFWNKASTLSKDNFQSQIKFWFDGFKTLKLIHHLRDTSLPQIDMFEAVQILTRMLGCEIKNEINPRHGDISGRINILNSLRTISAALAIDVIE